MEFSGISRNTIVMQQDNLGISGIRIQISMSESLECPTAIPK